MGVSKAVYNGKTLIDLTQDTVTETKLLSGYTAHKADGTIINGGITTKQAATYTPTTTDQTFAEDEYLYGNVVLKGDPNLLAENIKAGVTIFGVTGTAEEYIQPLPARSSTTTLSIARYDLGSASIGNYALFAGGSKITSSANYNYDTVDAYNISLTRSAPTALNFARGEGVRGASIGDYALFAGCASGSSSSAGMRRKVDVYNTSLTHSMAPDLQDGKEDSSASASNTNYVLFAGGFGGINKVEGYNSSLTLISAENLKANKCELSGISFGRFALFGGGGYSSYSTQVEIYDDSLTHTILTNLSQGKGRMGAASNNKYAMFGGGYTGSSVSKYVDAYDKNLTHYSPTSLNTARQRLSGLSFKNYVIFGGGYTATAVSPKYTSGFSNVVDTYNKNLTHTVTTNLSQSRPELASASVGDYALFAGGGYDSNVYVAYNTVDVYA
jgi:hypothetical protein